MDNRPDSGRVDAEAESIGGNDDGHLASYEATEDVAFSLCISHFAEKGRESELTCESLGLAYIFAVDDKLRILRSVVRRLLHLDQSPYDFLLICFVVHLTAVRDILAGRRGSTYRQLFGSYAGSVAPLGLLIKWEGNRQPDGLELVRSKLSKLQKCGPPSYGGVEQEVTLIDDEAVKPPRGL